jgi:hypothetical protein
MNLSLRSISRIAPVALCAALLLTVRPASAVDIAVPGALANTEGDVRNGFPFNIGEFSIGSVPITSMRYQQVYGASAFSGIVGPTTITQIAFRAAGREPASGGEPAYAGQPAFNATLTDIRIDLSTTSRQVDNLSNAFASNVGANNVTVFDGSLTLESAGATGNNPAPFDVIITLTTPFVYNPAEGNLLMDVRDFGGGISGFLDASSATNDAMSRVYALNVNDTIADTEFPSDGLITQFRFPSAVTVPEVNTVLLAASGLLLLGGVLVARQSRRTA